MKTHFLGIRLRGGTRKTFSISNLSEDKKKIVKKCKDFQCGLTGWITKNIADVPSFFKKFFDFDCDLHDLGFSRGGGLFDFIESNWNLIWRSHYDLFRFLIYGKVPLLNRILRLLVLTVLVEIMVVLLFIVGVYAFDWGKYKTFKKIINERCKKKNNGKN